MCVCMCVYVITNKAPQDNNRTHTIKKKDTSILSGWVLKGTKHVGLHHYDVMDIDTLAMVVKHHTTTPTCNIM